MSNNTGQQTLDDFEVYDPASEFTGGQIVDRTTAFEKIEEKYQFAARSGGRGGLSEQKNLAAMEVYGDALDQLKGDESIASIRSETTRIRTEAANDRRAADTDEEEAEAKGREQAATDIMEALK